MKVLFLDIDGVLCLYARGVKNWGQSAEDDAFDSGCCRRLKEIVDATGCKLVLSSSWRLEKQDIYTLLRQLAPYGITRDDFLGKTPLGQKRGDEIMTYLQRHPEVDTFLAVDDEDFADNCFPADKLLRTRQESGITPAIRDRAVRILNGER